MRDARRQTRNSLAREAQGATRCQPMMWSSAWDPFRSIPPVGPWQNPAAWGALLREAVTADGERAVSPFLRKSGAAPTLPSGLAKVAPPWLASGCAVLVSLSPSLPLVLACRSFRSRRISWAVASGRAATRRFRLRREPRTPFSELPAYQYGSAFEAIKGAGLPTAPTYSEHRCSDWSLAVLSAPG
jgi:hypothetical protein